MYGEWFYFSRTFTWSTLSAADTHVNIYGGASDGLLSYAKLIKLEKGTVATDWSPAPEDQVTDWNVTDVNSFAFLKNKPIKLTDFANDLGNYGSWITKAQGDSYYAPKSHSHAYLPLTGGIITGASYNMLTLARSNVNGSSILFKNSAGDLGKLGFASNGVFHLGNGASTDGVGNLLQITSTGNITAYGNINASGKTITATTFSGNASTASAVLTSAENTGTTSRYILFADNASGNQALKTDTGLKYVSSTNTITATLAGNASSATTAGSTSN